jgi:hypothetical protein
MAFELPIGKRQCRTCEPSLDQWVPGTARKGQPQGMCFTLTSQACTEFCIRRERPARLRGHSSLFAAVHLRVLDWPLRVSSYLCFKHMELSILRWCRGTGSNCRPRNLQSGATRASDTALSGSRSRAAHPGGGVRLSRVKAPPWASAICLDRARPMPVPFGLVV